jgi:hypothetical protein
MHETDFGLFAYILLQRFPNWWVASRLVVGREELLKRE